MMMVFRRLVDTFPILLLLVVEIVGGASALTLIPPTPAPTEAGFFGILSDVVIGGGTFRCGAALIHEDVMVTASFCSQVGDVVRVGYKTDKETLANRTVARFVTHPLAGGPQENFPNDIEVFQLDRPVFGIEILKVNDILAIPPDNGVNVTYAHAGAVPDVSQAFALGTVSLTKQFSTKVIVKNATTSSFIQCRRAYINSTPKYQSRLMEGVQFCTTTSPAFGPCDSAAWGSPLWVKDKYGKAILVGTASQGSCKVGNPPYVWTRIAQYNQWINQQVCRLSANPPKTCPK